MTRVANTVFSQNVGLAPSDADDIANEEREEDN